MATPSLIKEKSSLIKSLKPENQSIRYVRGNWERFLYDYSSFQSIIQKHTSSITRGEILSYKEKIEKPSQEDIESLFIMTMLFGFGSTGYGPSRTRNMIEDKNFHSVIMQTYEDIQSNNIEHAYRNFKLDKCGPAFFTKIFYFFGQGLTHNISPLILDSVVAKNLEEKCGCDISIYAAVIRHTSNSSSKYYKPILAGKIRAVSSDYHGYKRYIDDLHDWASDIDAKADQIELFLFNQ